MKKETKKAVKTLAWCILIAVMAMTIALLTYCGGAPSNKSSKTEKVDETDGTENVEEEVSVDFSDKKLIDIYPEPEDYISTGEITIFFVEQSQHYQYSISGFVAVEEVKNYIQAVKDVGFTSINSSYEGNDYIIYNANTEDDVYKVRISHYQDQESLSIIFDSIADLYVEEE